MKGTLDASLKKETLVESVMPELAGEEGQVTRGQSDVEVDKFAINKMRKEMKRGLLVVERDENKETEDSPAQIVSEEALCTSTTSTRAAECR